MSDIFESLENLNVSEECFDDIMGIVEELLDEGVLQKVKNFANNQINKAALGVTNSNSSLAQKIRSSKFGQKHILPRAVDGMIHNASKAEEQALNNKDGEAAMAHSGHADRLRRIKGSIEKAKQRGENPIDYLGSDKLNKHSVFNPGEEHYDSTSGIRDVVNRYKSKNNNKPVGLSGLNK